MNEQREFRKALITGISGSGGSYLAEYIVKHQPAVEVHGISRWHSAASNVNLSGILDQVKIHECDLLDFSSVLNVLNSVKPDVVFNLASHANVRASFINPLAVLNNNIMGTANLFEAIRSSGIDPVIMHCSTSEVYGQVSPHEVPIKEDQPMRPSSPYAVSKVTQDLLGLTYFRSYGMKIIRTRMFAYLNPKRTDLFATAFARQVALIEAGKCDILVHGNLDSIRTLIDVRDAMESYWVATLKCRFGEAYNIGGNVSISVADFLSKLKAYSNVEIASRQDPALLRPSDVTLQIPDLSKFISATGWHPKYNVEDSIKYLLDYWRKRVASERT